MTQCVNHPERAAVERCEVCQKALCAFCLYYTTDGQRLCAEHARQAQDAGAKIKPPGAYADSLAASQRDANRPLPIQDASFVGDTIDLLALIGLVVGIISVMMCIPFGVCLIGPAGLIMSVIALVGARGSRDPQRTRAMAGMGAFLSSIWLLIFVACMIAYSAQVMTFFRMNTTTNLPVQVTVVVPGVQQFQPTAAPTVTAPR